MVEFILVTVVDTNIGGKPSMILIPKSELSVEHMHVLSDVRGEQCFNKRALMRDRTCLLRAMHAFCTDGAEDERDFDGPCTDNWNLVNPDEWALNHMPSRARIADAMIVYQTPTDSDCEIDAEDTSDSDEEEAEESDGKEKEEEEDSDDSESPKGDEDRDKKKDEEEKEKEKKKGDDETEKKASSNKDDATEDDQPRREEKPVSKDSVRWSSGCFLVLTARPGLV